MQTYAVITPVRNEAEHIGKTVESMVAQTVRPSAWIIVDDGSNDGTAAIIDAAAAAHFWIRAMHRPDRGFRKPGGGVVEAFNDGLRFLAEIPGISPKKWSFLVKLDGDLWFAPDYFASCLAEFAKDSRLGIAGGTVCALRNGEFAPESPSDPVFHVRGATKIYRRECWEMLGGLLAVPGWDTLDELKANMLGWRTGTLEAIKLLQLKQTGAADGSWRNWVKNGCANYITGYHPLFMICKCLGRLVRQRSLLMPCGLWWGYLTAFARGTPRVRDRELLMYIRSQQIKGLLGRPSLWTR